MTDEPKTDRFPTLPADDPLFKGGFVIGSKRPARVTYHGSVPATDPRYQSGYNFLSGKSLSPPIRDAEPSAGGEGEHEPGKVKPRR